MIASVPETWKRELWGGGGLRDSTVPESSAHLSPQFLTRSSLSHQCFQQSLTCTSPCTHHFPSPHLELSLSVLLTTISNFYIPHLPFPLSPPLQLEPSLSLTYLQLLHIVLTIPFLPTSSLWALSHFTSNNLQFLHLLVYIMPSFPTSSLGAFSLSLTYLQLLYISCSPFPFSPPPHLELYLSHFTYNHL